MIRRAAIAGGDLLGATAVMLAIPLAILAIGIPLALVVRMVLWMVGAL
jgi:hypothetical protein